MVQNDGVHQKYMKKNVSHSVWKQRHILVGLLHKFIH